MSILPGFSAITLKGWDTVHHSDPVNKLLHVISKEHGLLPSLKAGFPTMVGKRYPTITLLVKIMDGVAFFRLES